eukprot:4996816-Amphidinium_carterae.1
MSRGRKPIPCGWVDVNKGDEQTWNVRSRLVVKETRHNSSLTSPSEIYSSTPPYEALRFIISYAMTRRGDQKPWDRTVMFLDITRAHPHCKVSRELYVELPYEDPASANGDSCAKLERCLYGTRDAGRAFELFVYQRQILAFVYGDKFTTVAERTEQDWFKSALAQHMWSKHEGTIGPGKEDDREAVCLNRICRWNVATPTQPESIDMEADSRHVDILRSGIGLNEKSKSVVTPGLTAKDGAIGEQLSQEDGVLYRSLVMRCNYLSADRPEIR